AGIGLHVEGHEGGRRGGKRFVVAEKQALRIRREVEIEGAREVRLPESDPVARSDEPAVGEESGGGRVVTQVVVSDADDAVCAHVDGRRDRKSTRLNSSHQITSYAVFCLKKKQPRQHA